MWSSAICVREALWSVTSKFVVGVVLEGKDAMKRNLQGVDDGLPDVDRTPGGGGGRGERVMSGWWWVCAQPRWPGGVCALSG